MTLEEEAIKMVQGSRLSVKPARLIELHKALINDGRPDKWYCTTCSGKLNMIFTDLKLKYYQKSNTDMATTKYRFSKAAKDNGVSEIVIMNNGRTEVVRAETLTDAQAERVLKNKQFAHNIEVVKTKESEETETKPAAKTTTTTKTSK